LATLAILAENEDNEPAKWKNGKNAGDGYALSCYEFQERVVSQFSIDPLTATCCASIMMY